MKNGLYASKQSLLAFWERMWTVFIPH